MRFRSVALVLAALVVLAMLGGCATGGGTSTTSVTTGSATAQPVKVGAVLSLTGSYAGIGASEKKALELEVKKINDAGGINGRKVELIIKDDGTDAAKAQAAATQLIDQDKVVAIIGASGTGQTMAMAPDIQRAAIPVVSLAGGSAVTAKIISQLFQVPWPNRLVVPFVLADMKKQGVTKVALLTDSSGYGKDGLAVIKQAAAPAGLTIVAEETFNPGDTDMTAQLTKLKSSGADAVLLWTAGKEGATVLKNRAALNMTQPFFGGSGQGRKEFIAGAGSAAEGFRFGTGKELVPAAWGSAPNAAVEAEFVKAYKAAYGTDIDIFAGHAYDGIAIVAAAIKNVTGEVTPAALRDAIEKTSGLVGVGGTYTFSPSDHNGLSDKDLQVYTVKDGSFQIAQ